MKKAFKDIIKMSKSKPEQLYRVVRRYTTNNTPLQVNFYRLKNGVFAHIEGNEHYDFFYNKVKLRESKNAEFIIDIY